MAGSSPEFEEGRRIWSGLTEEQKGEIIRYAGRDLVEATSEDDPPPFPINRITVRQYAIQLLGQLALDKRAVDEEYATYSEEEQDQ
jgi:hypothetical protein